MNQAPAKKCAPARKACIRIHTPEVRPGFNAPIKFGEVHLVMQDICDAEMRTLSLPPGIDWEQVCALGHRLARQHREIQHAMRVLVKYSLL